MSPLFFAYTLATLVIAAVIFLVFRLKFFSGDGVGGRSAFVFGGLMLCLAVVWQIVKGADAYPDWFLTDAYFYLDLVHLLVTVAGLLFIVIGLALFADHWQTKREQIHQREQRLSILNNVQVDARQPYQLLELLEMTLKEIVTSIDETSGAVLLFNRSQRQFILTASMGLSRDEIASMEYYPIGRNPLTQAIELGDSALSGSFKFIDREGNKKESRFHSCLILPMISGSDRVGVMVLMSPNSDTFDRSDLRYLEPLSEWLAEKIKGARTARNLAAMTQKIDSFKHDTADLAARLQQASTAFGSGDPISGYCQSLVGLSGATSVHLVGIINSGLQIYGGSSPLIDISENYRTALVDALDRRKPLIINQEAGGSDQPGYIAVSTLIIPCASSDGLNALILRREGAPFSVSDDILKRIEIFAGLAEAVLLHDNSMKLNTTRRKGFQKILELLKMSEGQTFESTPNFFVTQLADVLPRNSKAIAFEPAADGNYHAVSARGIDQSLLEDFAVMPGEGEVGQAPHLKSPIFATGRKNVAAKLESYETLNRDAFRRTFGENGIPAMMAVCPINGSDQPGGAAVFLLFDSTDAEAAEYSRLLTLAHGLFTVRQFVEGQMRATEPPIAEADKALQSGRAINELNNRLAAILGCAELTAKRTDISSEVRDQIDAIIVQAEQAADFLKDQTVAINNSQPAQSTEETIEPKVSGSTINEILSRSLNNNRISDNLYLIDGRTREIDLKLEMVPRIELPSESLTEFAHELLDKFSRLAEEDDKISLSTYADDSYVYLDISRHRKNFPPVERVADFGDYRHSTEILEYRPADSFLTHLSESHAGYTYDRHSQIPSYLSFKFPIAGRTPAEDRSGQGKRLLAIDDQAVILDLIRAMCQPLGYEVQTAASGEEGLAKAEAEDFDIILTDLAMPGISGLEVARRVTAAKPGTPIILVTGWEVKVDDDELAATGIKKVLFKPFRIEQLSQAISAVIADKSIS